MGTAGYAWRRVILALAVLAAMGFLGRGLLGPSAVAQAPGPAPGGPTVPVTVAKADRRDVAVWLRGLGTVQPLNSVVVRARVDGTLMRVPVTEGQLVELGTPLAVIDTRPYQAALDQAVAKKAQDEAQLANARLDLQRYASLARQDYASRQQVDTQTAMVNQFIAALKGDDAAIEVAQLNLSFCYITAPFAGRVGLRLVDPGNLVHATDTGGILTLNQVRPITLVFTLPQKDLQPIVQEMAKGQLEVAAWSGDDATELAHGVLLTPDNGIDVTTGTIKLKASFANPDDKLWPGQFVEARLKLRTESQVVTVPSRAVQHSPSGLYIYLVKPDSTVQRQPVEVEDRGDIMVVTKGLDAGQEVVLDGQSRLENGTRVAATAAPASPPSQAGG